MPSAFHLENLKLVNDALQDLPVGDIEVDVACLCKEFGTKIMIRGRKHGKRLFFVNYYIHDAEDQTSVKAALEYLCSWLKGMEMCQQIARPDSDNSDME